MFPTSVVTDLLYSKMQSSRGDCEKECPRINKESAHSAISAEKPRTSADSTADVPSDCFGTPGARGDASGTAGEYGRTHACGFVDTAVQNVAGLTMHDESGCSVVVEPHMVDPTPPSVREQPSPLRDSSVGRDRLERKGGGGETSPSRGAVTERMERLPGCFRERRSRRENHRGAALRWGASR